ncbi:hypothetical protein FW778_21875 [Ginsengibacter hankyongi]|uniref:Uncharacterized protein n=1 Tax=Ginsengibacter hankyongi TaxID=2607284 RepID=A0A5J5IF92_9BACT|nr:hypothetical protein [Ginsengibacter hankyongi]KAA9034661.1 hypothetical protein FW778_21875 [Ginsengibacter hankyongi]
MKSISFWAKNHIWQSRLMIFMIYVLINVIGLFIGKLLNDINVTLPGLYFITCVIFTVILWIGYSGTNVSAARLFTRYFRRKFFDFALGLLTFSMIIYGGNNYKNFFINNEAVNAFSIHHLSKDSAIYYNPLIQNFIASIKNMDVSKLSLKEKKRIIKHQIKTIKHDKDTSEGNKALLIILSVIIALVLLYGLAALSCSLSCSGSEALAVIVAIGGTFLIVFFLIRIIKRITNPPSSARK